jgi:hypothetical protein
MIPALSGFGRILAGLMIKSSPPKSIESGENFQPAREVTEAARPPLARGFTSPEEQPMSVVENTTKTLDKKIPGARQ